MYKINEWLHINENIYTINRDLHGIARQEFEGKKYNVAHDYDKERFPAIIFTGSLKECRNFLKKLAKKGAKV